MKFMFIGEAVTPEYFLAEVDSILIAMLTVIVVLFLLFFAFSKVTKESFDWIEYLVVVSLMFVTVVASVIVVGTVFQALIERYQVLDLDRPMQINILMGLTYFVVLFGPFYAILHNTFMFLKTRLIVVASYCLIMAILATLFAGI